MKHIYSRFQYMPTICICIQNLFLATVSGIKHATQYCLNYLIQYY